MSRILRVWLFAVLASAVPCFGLDPNRELTQYVHRIWQTQHGLPDGAILNILQDNAGYLWLATEAGLYRFDGVNFAPGSELLLPDPPVNGYIRAVALDSSGAFWLGGNDNNVYRIQGQTLTKYTADQGLPGGLLQCLLPARNGLVWACTERGMAIIDPRKPAEKVTVLREELPSQNVRAVCEDQQGRIWIGGDTPYITIYDQGKLSRHALKGPPQAASVRYLLCDGDTVWAGTSFGLLQLVTANPESNQRYFTSRDGLVDDFVFWVAKGAGGVYWIGTRSGFSRLRNNNWDSYRPQDGLSQSTAQAVFEDREGSLWVGTKRGLNQFVDGRGVPYTVSEGLPSNETGPVLQDSKGVIWAGTLDAGLAHLDGRRFAGILTSGDLPSKRVHAMVEDRDGSLWVGTDKGLGRIRDGRVTARYGTGDGLPSAAIRSLLQSADGTVWIGTAAGLASLSRGRIDPQPGAPHAEIRSIGQDRTGAILVATEEGVYRRLAGSWQPVTQSGIYMRNVNTFFLDPDGLLWAGLNGAGLRLIDGNKITSYYSRDGLYDAELYGIQLDGDDRLWIACSRGVFWIPRKELRQYASGEIDRVHSVAYTPTDALRVIEGRPGVQPALQRMKDGRMWFSTVRGLIAVDPQQPKRESAPPVAIETPVVNGAPVPPDQLGQLAAGQKNLEFTYAGLSYLLPDQIRFRYRLEGFDANWIDAGRRRQAFYTNLPPGDYTFRVTACSYDGPCNETGAAIQFTLAPFLYQRVWFWPLMLLLSGGLGWGAYQLHIRRLRARYDLILSERSRIARELHDTLIQG
ncbi:MAG: Nitrate/nitrite sensor protein NarX, partial [Acidobacteriota bacterium]